MLPEIDQEVFENKAQPVSPVKPNVFESIQKWVSGLHVITKSELEEAGVFIGNHQDLENHP